MSVLSEIQANGKKFQQFVEQDQLQEASTLLRTLKIAMQQLTSLPPIEAQTATSTEERLIARHILEWAALLSVKLEDMEAFERNITQLKVYFTDFNKELPESELYYSIIGMRLIHLLVENRMAEFHGELELIAEHGRLDANIAYAIKLEQGLMEGSYSKVLDARKDAPNPYWKPFMNKLLETVRDGIAECMEVAYPSLTFGDAQKMLKFDSENALLAYVTEHKPDWMVKNKILWFKPPQKCLGASDIPSLMLVKETLAYATELDRIV